jgi:citrate lyase gamma subunit
LLINNFSIFHSNDTQSHIIPLNDNNLSEQFSSTAKLQYLNQISDIVVGVVGRHHIVGEDQVEEEDLCSSVGQEEAHTLRNQVGAASVVA